MRAARRTHIPDTPLLVGKTWFYASGARVKHVAGGDGDEPATVPDTLTDITDEDLDALEVQLIEQFDKLHDEGSTDIAAMEAIAEQIERISVEKDERKAADEQAAAKAKELYDKVHPPAASNDDGDGDEGGDDGDDPGEGEGTGDDGGEGASTDPAKEAVTASARAAQRRPASASGTSRRSRRPSVPDQSAPITITAAADLPGITTGSQIDLLQVATAMHDKARTLSNHSAKIPIARFNIPYAADVHLKKGTTQEAALEMLDRITDPTRLMVNGIVAAGGWCTPSQNLYDLLALDAATGLFDVPSMGIERGGVNVPSYIGIDSADGALWTWSEDQDADISLVVADLDIVGGVGTMSTTGPHLLEIGDMVDLQTTNPLANGPRTVLTVTDADTVTLDMTGVPDAANATGTAIRQKGCFSIPCPTWDDVRLGAYGLCLRHGSLTDRAFPELTRRYVSLVMNAHLHRMSAINTAKVRSTVHSVLVTMLAGDSDAYGDLMSAIELQITDYRSEHKISDRVVIEIGLPSWTQEFLRSNLAKRQGVDLLAVSDATLAAHFGTRNTRVQFLEDYQPMWDGTPRDAWPTTIEFFMYPAGSIFEGNGGTIDLGVLRDSRLNATNDFTAAWSEDFRLIGRRGPKGRTVTVPSLASDGVTGCCSVA